jgi:hypothetical protein
VPSNLSLGLKASSIGASSPPPAKDPESDHDSLASVKFVAFAPFGTSPACTGITIVKLLALVLFVRFGAANTISAVCHINCVTDAP